MPPNVTKHHAEQAPGVQPVVGVQPMVALTTLRFFAAFYVVLFHAFPWKALVQSESPWSRALGQFCGRGYSAVSFFFALSGFILACNYPPQRAVAERAFYRARFARIYPAYALGLAAGLPFIVARAARDGAWGRALLEMTLALTLTQAWVPTMWNAINPPGWSLSVEAFFYLLFPRLSQLLARVASSEGRALALLTALYAGALGPALIATLTMASGMPLEDESALANMVRYAPPLALPEFAFGVVLGHMQRARMRATRIAAQQFWPALALLWPALATEGVPYALVHNGLLLPLFAVIILRCADTESAPRLLANPRLATLGEASYSLYIIHLLAWVYVKIGLERSGIDPLAPWVFPAYALLAVALSLASHRWIEQPFRLLLLRARPPSPPARAAERPYAHGRSEER